MPPHHFLLPSFNPPTETKTEPVHPAERTPQTHPGYYVFSPDDDDSSEEDYDPDCGGVCVWGGGAIGEVTEERC